MSKPILFARLAKFDEATGYFEAIAADETLDKTQEIFDYAKSKPHFQAWSALIEKATDGKSVGNVRAMHGKVSAGVLKRLDFDDEHRAIKVSGLVVDVNEKTKMAAGCYTGVSIGGDYGERWEDPVQKGVTRYEAKPVEISIVDVPCNPAAMFTVVKADKSEEMRKFAPREEDVTVTISAMDPESLKKFLAELPPDALKQAMEKVAQRKDTSKTEGEDKYGNVTFADSTNKKYPIDTPAHIRAAWNYINKAKNAGKYSSEDAKAIKSKIVAAWKEHIDPKGPPSAEKALEGAEMAKAASIDCAASVLVEKAAKDAKVAGQLSKLAQFTGAPLEKGFWAVSQLADLLMRLEWCMRDSECEEAMEQDGSTIPAQLAEAGANLCHILLAMAEEECDETFKHGDYEEDDGETMKAVAAGKLAKVSTRRSAELPAMTKRATEAEAKVADLEKAGVASTARITALEKDVTDGHALMQKAADTIDEQKRVLEKIMASPSAKRPAMFAVSKSDDVLPAPGDDKDEKPILKADGTKDEVRTALRKALSRPIVQA